MGVDVVGWSRALWDRVATSVADSLRPNAVDSPDASLPLRPHGVTFGEDSLELLRMVVRNAPRSEIDAEHSKHLTQPIELRDEGVGVGAGAIREVPSALIEVLCGSIPSENVCPAAKLKTSANKLYRFYQQPIYDSMFATAVHYAAWSGHLPTLRYVVDNGGDVDAIDTRGATALHYAARSRNPDALRFVAERTAASVAAVDRRGDNAVHYAAASGEPAVFAAAVALGCGAPDAPCGREPHNTPVHIAAGTGVAPVLSAVLAAVAAANSGGPAAAKEAVRAANDYRETPLHFAARSGSAAAMRVAVEAGADATARTKRGASVLHYACRGSLPATRFAVDALGLSDVSDPASDGATPVHFAAGSRSPDAVGILKFLASRGANIAAQTFTGDNAALYASRRFSTALGRPGMRIDVVEFLESYGVRRSKPGMALR